MVNLIVKSKVKEIIKGKGDYNVAKDTYGVLNDYFELLANELIDEALINLKKGTKTVKAELIEKVIRDGNSDEAYEPLNREIEFNETNGYK
jgi:histone H3/H4